MRHDAFLYDTDDGLADGITPYLAEGLEREEPVVVVVDPRKRAVLREALGSDGHSVFYIDRDSHYTRPESVLASYDGTVRRFLAGGARAVRLFGELPICTSETDWNVWISYEAIVNHAFANRPLSIICGYDAREVPDDVLQSSWETHGAGLSDHRVESPHYRDPEDVLRARMPEPAAVSGLSALALDGRPSDVRARLIAVALRAGVPEGEIEKLVLAAGEVLANAWQHGAGTRSARVGRVGERFVCEVSDEGPGIESPLAGYLPPRPGQTEGAGLWAARQLTRQLDLLPSPDGMTVRLWV